MKKNIFPILLGAALLCSCTSKMSYIDDSISGLALNLSTDNSYREVKGGADDGQLQKDLNELLVNIEPISLDDPTSIQDPIRKTYGSLDAVIKLVPGKYNIKVESHNTLPVAIDQPIYGASAQFEVKKGAATPLNLICTVQNVKISFVLEKSFTDEMKDYSVTVLSGDIENPNGIIETLVLSKEDLDAGKSAFVTVNPFSVTVKAFRKLDVANNKEIQQIYSVTSGIAAADWHEFTISATGTGTMSSIIDIDYTYNKKSKQIQIEGLSEEPVGADKIAPVLKAQSLANNATDVNINQKKITLTFESSISLAADQAISLKKDNNENVAVSASVNGKVLSVEFGTLEESTHYTLSVPAASVLNKNGDISMENSVSIAFTTGENKVEPILVTCPGIDEPLSYSEGNTVPMVMTVSAVNGIKNLEITIPSDALVGMLSDVGQTPNVDLCNMDAGQEEFWGGLFGITSSDVIGKSEFTLDVTGFTSLIPKANNVMNFKVTDNNGNFKEVSIKINVN